MALRTTKQTQTREIDTTEDYYTNTDNISKFENGDKPMVTENDNNNIKYFLPGPNSNNKKRVSTEIMKQLQKEFKDSINDKML